MNDELPEVHDEASDTPVWIPIVGALILCALSIAALVRGAMPQPAPPVAEVAAEAPPAAAAAEDAPPAPTE